MRAAVAAALTLGAAASSQAATVCLAAASALVFGIYDPLASGAAETTATVTVTCTPTLGSPLTTAYSIGIAGTGVGNDAVRSASVSGQRLYYQVYKDPGRSQVWGDGATAGSAVAGSVTSVAVAVPAVRTHVAYVRMAAGQRVAAGIYLGSLLVTVDY